MGETSSNDVFAIWGIPYAVDIWPLSGHMFGALSCDTFGFCILGRRAIHGNTCLALENKRTCASDKRFWYLENK